MGEEDDQRRRATDTYVRRLVTETGIAEKQARDLISVLGMNWASLVREAKNLRR